MLAVACFFPAELTSVDRADLLAAQQVLAVGAAACTLLRQCCLNERVRPGTASLCYV